MDVDHVRDKKWKVGMLADRFYAYITNNTDNESIGEKLVNIDYDMRQY